MRNYNPTPIIYWSRSKSYFQCVKEIGQTQHNVWHFSFNQHMCNSYEKLLEKLFPVSSEVFHVTCESAVQERQIHRQVLRSRRLLQVCHNSCLNKPHKSVNTSFG